MSATFDLNGLVREIDADGIGWNPRRARQRNLAPPEIVFVRDDGWSVGAFGRLAEREAWQAWGERYVSFARAADGWTLRPIEEYRP